MSNAPVAERPSVVLPIIAIVAFFVCFPIGTILSIVSFVKYNKFPGTEARTLSIVALVGNALVVPMIGVLAAIAIPNFVKFQCRSKQSEAKANLRSLSVAEEAYFAEKGEYSRDAGVIGFAPTGAKVRYEYAIVQAGKDSYVAEARGMRDGVAGDVWTVDKTRELKNVTNVCSPR